MKSYLWFIKSRNQNLAPQLRSVPRKIHSCVGLSTFEAGFLLFYLTFQPGRERISEYSSSAESRYVPVTPKGMWWVGSKKEKARAGRGNAHRRKRFSTVRKRVIDLLDQKARAKPNNHGMQRIYNPLKLQRRGERRATINEVLGSLQTLRRRRMYVSVL